MSKSCSQEIASDIFECCLDRAEAGMPDYFVPEAPGVLLAGKDMLIAAGNVPGAPGPAGWTPGLPLVPEVRWMAAWRRQRQILKNHRWMAIACFELSGSASSGCLNGPSE